MSSAGSAVSATSSHLSAPARRPAVIIGLRPKRSRILPARRNTPISLATPTVQARAMRSADMPSCLSRMLKYTPKGPADTAARVAGGEEHGESPAAKQKPEVRPEPGARPARLLRQSENDENEQKPHARHQGKDGGDAGEPDQAPRAGGRRDEAQGAPQAHPAVLRPRLLDLAQAQVLGYRHEGRLEGGEYRDEREQRGEAARPPQQQRGGRAQERAREGHAPPQAKLVRQRARQRGRERAREARGRVQQAELKPAHADGMVKDVQERKQDAHAEKMQEVEGGHPPGGRGGLRRAHGRAPEKRGIGDLFSPGRGFPIRA